jgi:hypothetical protein
MNDKIKELKALLFELDSKHSVSVPDTQQNINDATKRIVKLFAIPVVVGQSEQLFCYHKGSYTLNKDGTCCKCHRPPEPKAK